MRYNAINKEHFFHSYETIDLHQNYEEMNYINFITFLLIFFEQSILMYLMRSIRLSGRSSQMTVKLHMNNFIRMILRPWSCTVIKYD